MVTEPAASIEVIALSDDERRLDIRASIAAPQRQGDGSWICRVVVAPLQEQALDVRGVDSFHALWLACSLILKLLTQLKDGGARLQSADGSEFPLDAYLAGLDGKR
jgi:hypothetical protein